MRIDLFKTYLTVAALGNMTKAGELLGLSASAVSKQMKDFEAAYNKTFFNSTANGVVLTEEGLKFLEVASRFWEEFQKTYTFLKEISNSAEGPLKVIPTTFGVHWFSNHIDEFTDRYPNIEISIAADEYKSLLYASGIEGVFIGLTSFEPPPKTPYIWTKLGSFNAYPFAHPSYIKKYGKPQKIEDLNHHKIVRYKWSSEYSYISDKESNILLNIGRPRNMPRKHIVTIDDAVGCRTLIEKGAGIGLIPRYLAYGRDLEELLIGAYNPKYGPVRNVYIVYPPYLKDNARIKIFKEFVQEKILKPSTTPFT